MSDGAVYRFLMSVDARGSGRYLDGEKVRMRALLYQCADGAFAATGVGASLMRREDRGDGFIAAVDARVPPAQLAGPWLAELHQRLSAGNEDLARRLGLRVGMHVGPVRFDREGMAGTAVDLVCRLADSAEAKAVLAHSGRDLVCVASDALYREVIRHGGRFIEPSAYRAAGVDLKEGPATAWFHVPGEARPAVPGDAGFGDASDAGNTGESEPPRQPDEWEDGSDGGGSDGGDAHYDVRAEGDSIVLHRPDFRGGTTNFGGRR